MANPFLYSAPTFDYYPSEEPVPWQGPWLQIQSFEMCLPEAEFFPALEQPLEYYNTLPQLLSVPSVGAYAMALPFEPYTGYLNNSPIDYSLEGNAISDWFDWFQLSDSDGALDPHYEFTNSSPREGVDNVLTQNSSQEQPGSCTEPNDEAIVSEDLLVGESSQETEVVDFRFRQWKNHGERHKSQQSRAEKKKTVLSSKKKKISEKGSASKTPIKKRTKTTGTLPAKRRKTSVVAPDPNPQAVFTQLQATAQAPMLIPFVTLTRGGRLPQSMYIHETGRTEEGQIRRIRACGLE